MRHVTWWISVLAVGSSVMGAQTFDDVRNRWRAGDYSNALRPLIDWHYKVPAQSPAAQEIDYMIAHALCVIPEYKFKEGCEYSQNLSRLYGGYLFFEGRRFSTADLASGCCPVARADLPGVRGIASVRDPRPLDQILNDVAQTLLVTTTLNVQRTEVTLPGDWITGFRLIGIDRSVESFWHWMTRLEVEYVCNIGHGSVIVTGTAKGGPLVSGYSHWGPPQEQPYGPQFRKGVQKLQIAIQVQQPEAAVSILSLTLQEAVTPYRTIITQDFPFAHVYRLP